MAQIKVLKIAANGDDLEHDGSADDLTMLSFTVDGGLVASSTGIDMNNGDISDLNDLSFTDPTTDGITRTDGTHAADDMMFEDAENSMDVGAAILFPVISDAVDEVDAFRLPVLAGVPSAAPADGGEGYQIWDSTNNHLYVWDGAAWDNQSVVDTAKNTCNAYTAATGNTFAIGDLAYVSAADEVSLADVSSSGAASRVVGMASTAAAPAATVEICDAGVVDGLSGLTAGSRYWANPAAAGGITTTVPVGTGNVLYMVGYAKSATAMHLQLDRRSRRA